MGWSGLHMKRCKQGKTVSWNGEKYIPYVQSEVERSLAKFNRFMPYPAGDNPLGEACIYEKQWIEHYLNGL